MELFGRLKMEQAVLQTNTDFRRDEGYWRRWVMNAERKISSSLKEDHSWVLKQKKLRKIGRKKTEKKLLGVFEIFDKKKKKKASRHPDYLKWH
jgi:hypothetical protein